MWLEWPVRSVVPKCQASLPGVTGCNLLAFDPQVEVQPDTLLADEPVGLGVNLKVPQTESPKCVRRRSCVTRL